LVGIEVYEFNAHLLNLLGEKFTSKPLQEAISFVQAFMKNHHFTSGCLKEMNALRPVMPNSTRWNSQMDSFANYKINHTKYLDVMRRYKSNDGKDKDKCEKIMKILEDPNVYSEVSSALEVLQPISLALDKVNL
jgi:hypothetical protein